MLWKAALTRRISRMVFKCRLSLTSPVRTRNGSSKSAIIGGAGGATGGSKRGSSSASRADNAYLLAVFFVFFLLVMIVTQVMVMRSELSSSAPGKSHPRSFRPLSSSSSSSSTGQQTNRQQQQAERPAAGPFRFGRQPAPFGRVLAADTVGRDSGPNTAGAGDANTAAPRPELVMPNANDMTPPVLTAGEWLRRLPQQQSRDAWVDQLWLCFQGRSICPWQPVVGRDKCFVYSAYLDDSNSQQQQPGGTNGSGVVRVIGVARTKKPDRLWCQLGWTVPFNNTVRWSAVPAQIKTIREHWNLRYSAVFILCPLSKAPSQVRPEFVSISTSQNPSGMLDRDLPTRPTSTMAEFNASYGHWAGSPTGNLLPITRYRDSAGEPKHQLTVCVKPLHYSFNRVGQLIEFIEIHRLLGVSHFTFYNHTVGDQVDCVLRRYAEQGLVDVLPWRQLDVASQKEIRTEGIFASLNDCLYRHMFDSQYLLMIDLDELIVPRTKLTLTEMIASTMANSSINSSSSSNRIGAYYFRNAFFYLSWPDDSGVHPQWTGDHLDLISLRKTRRNVKLHPHRIRSKYICRPRAVVEVGNHFVWEFRAGHVAAHVPDSLAVMHHYRTCEFGGDTCLANPSVQDRSAWKYGDALVSSVRHRFQQFREICPSSTAQPAAAAAAAAAGLVMLRHTSMATIAASSTNATTTMSPFLS